MGGLVVKAMLDDRADAPVLPNGTLFVSVSSPWRGVEASRYSDRLPTHPLSWDDLAPTSAFVAEMQATPLLFCRL
jgi:hypothetical protein